MRADLAAKPHTVYRCFNVAGALLYVGCTHDLKKRLAQHRGQSTNPLSRAPWYDLVAVVTTEEHPDAASGYAREAEVVRDERPAFNVAYHGKPSPRAFGFVVRPHAPAVGAA